MEILTINRAEHIKLPKESKPKKINIFSGRFFVGLFLYLQVG